LILVNKGHAALAEVVIAQKLVLGLNQDVDDGVTDAYDVERTGGAEPGSGGHLCCR
jgi:hypothetical protein